MSLPKLVVFNISLYFPFFQGEIYINIPFTNNKSVYVYSAVDVQTTPQDLLLLQETPENEQEGHSADFLNRSPNVNSSSPRIAEITNLPTGRTLSTVASQSAAQFLPKQRYRRKITRRKLNKSYYCCMLFYKNSFCIDLNHVY